MGEERNRDAGGASNVGDGPVEAEILTGDTSHKPDATIEPWEEGENTQGFQHGSWDYNQARNDHSGWGTDVDRTGITDESVAE
jgi:hypothetical protein